MDRKQMCVANVQYKKASGGAASRARGLLGYLTYRDSRDQAAVFKPGKERWVDRGLGGSVAEIAGRCEDLHSKHVLMFSLVYNVNPDLIAMVAPEQREPFVRELTEKTTETFFEARGIDTGVEYSYVTHHRQTEDPEAPGRHDPHTHVVLPGTYYDDGLGERVPLYFSRNRGVNHIELLHTVTETQMAEQMERYVGRDWEQRYDRLQAVREREKAVTQEPTDGRSIEPDGPMDFWYGSRATDEHTSAAGYYRTAEDGVAFRPLVRGLRPHEAELLVGLFRSEYGGDIARLRALAEGLDGMTLAQRASLFAEIERLDAAPPSQPSYPTYQTPGFDIDF